MLTLPQQSAGSLVFFAGTGFISRAIALRTCSWSQLFHRQWISHVGFTIEYQRQVVLIESTTLDITPCCIRNLKTRGVQAHPLEQRIKEYSGHVWIAAPVLTGLKEQYIRSRSARLTDLALAKLGIPYDTLGALMTGTNWAKHWYHYNLAHFFCSELTGWTLEQVAMSPVKRSEVAGLIMPAELARFCEFGETHGDLEQRK